MLTYNTHDPLPVHLNLNARGLKQSATLAINERSHQRQQLGQPVYRLGLGQSPFPVPEVVVEALREHAAEKDYLPVKGLHTLREEIANYHCRCARCAGIECSSDDVLVGPGSKELMFLLQLVYYGDLVIPTPSWVSYAPQAQLLGRHVRWVETQAANGWRLTARELHSLCSEDVGRPRIVVLNYPANPTGSTYQPDELESLAGVAREHGVVLLSDEIYGELQHDGQHISAAQFYPEGTIISSGLSKWCGAGGWRLGTFTFPPGLRWLLDAMANAASETFTSTCAPVQHAAVRAFQSGPEIVNYLTQARRILKALGTTSHVLLTEAGASVALPQGGFYLFPDFSAGADRLRKRGIYTGDQLCERLIEDTGVAILPGSVFGRPASELTARIAYVDFDGQTAMLAARKMPFEEPLGEQFTRVYCRPTVEAIGLICDWFQDG